MDPLTGRSVRARPAPPCLEDLSGEQSGRPVPAPRLAPDPSIGAAPSCSPDSVSERQIGRYGRDRGDRLDSRTRGCAAKIAQSGALRQQALAGRVARASVIGPAIPDAARRDVPDAIGGLEAGGQPVLVSGRGTLANADSVNHRGTARRAAVVPCMFSAPERRASAHSLSPRQISTMWGNVVVTVTVTG